MTSKPADSSAILQQIAAREGISIYGTTLATLPAQVGKRLRSFVVSGHHGEMDWMEERVHERTSPHHLWPEARSAVVFALPYGQDMEPMARLAEKSIGVISIYALNRDYHDVFKGKLKRIAQDFAARTKADVKVFVDTAPVMEKPLAQQAGLGWQGRHTNLVSRALGSWFFLGVMLTTAQLSSGEPEADHCGSCRACLDVCPTQAFPAPYQLDARRCISYLTIEHKGHIAPEFRQAMGNRIYGCDDCLAVCPWNKFAQTASEAKLTAREDLKSPALEDLLKLNDHQFRVLFSGSAVKRIGRNRFVRNCLIAAGNSGDRKMLPDILALLHDPSSLVRAMAIWALRQLDLTLWNERRSDHLPKETDDAVKLEWQGSAP